MLNQSVLVGRLVKDPEVKELDNDKKVCNITLAIPRSYKNENGEYETDFIDCALWNGIAENTAEYCHRGDMIGVKGHIQTKTVETEKGKHNESYVVAEKITFLASSKDKEKEDKQESNDLEV